MENFTVIKRDAWGKETLRYRGRLRERDADFVCIDAIFALPERDLGYIHLRPGDRFREWFYAGRYFNIFRVADVASGALKGWYCNITRPPNISARQVVADDLCLDLFVYPDGRRLLLDEAEFAALGLPPPEIEAAWRAVAALETMVKNRQPPFAEIARVQPS